MGIYSGAIMIALVIIGAAVAFALLPELLERMPRRRARREEHLLRPSRDEEGPRRRRPALKREAPVEAETPVEAEEPPADRSA